MEAIASISILWQPRKEPLAILVEKLEKALHFLANQYPQIYANWYQLGKSLKQATIQPISIDKESLTTLLLKSNKLLSLLN